MGRPHNRKEEEGVIAYTSREQDEIQTWILCPHGSLGSATGIVSSFCSIAIYSGGSVPLGDLVVRLLLFNSFLIRYWHL